MRSPLPMTVRDFIAWDPGNHQRYELVDPVYAGTGVTD